MNIRFDETSKRFRFLYKEPANYIIRIAWYNEKITDCLLTIVLHIFTVANKNNVVLLIKAFQERIY